MDLETPQRLEPTQLDRVAPQLTDLVADLAAVSSSLGKSLHPATATQLAGLVRVMNTYYSNLIEGHNTRPRDIARALAGDLDKNVDRRNLQIEAAAHVRLQSEVDRIGAEGLLDEPASEGFVRWLHREFYRDAPQAMLEIKGKKSSFVMVPGEWRSKAEQDVAVGRHLPPSSRRVPAFMTYFEERYRLKGLGKGAAILAIAAAHHRFNYIHPFPDGNGRVSRLMSHAMTYFAGIDAHGLWSISRGLARGLKRRGEYKEMMDHADMPRQGDRDGRGNLSEKALEEFTEWFLRVCIDQVSFMSALFDLSSLSRRIRIYVERSENLKPESAAILEEALIRGEVERGAVTRITGLPERSARRVLADTIGAGLLGSPTPKAPVSLRFPEHALETLFPKLYAES